MKKMIILGILCLMVLGTVSAVIDVDIYTEPYSTTFTPEGEITKSLTQIRSELNLKSCYKSENYEAKSCQYMYYCFAIMPHNSNNIMDALVKECEDVTDKTSVTLQLNNFLPPKGILYYVTTFVTVLYYQHDGANWNPTPDIPSAYAKAHPIRSECQSGQMLGVERDPATGLPIKPKCYIAERVCLDTMKTGVCTNAYPIYCLDMNNDGVISPSELADATNYCTDSNKDRICDYTVDLECVDICKDFSYNKNTGQFTCQISGSNKICDEWDKAAEFGCIDAELSPNSNICDDVDVEGCLKAYDPVCVAKTAGTKINGTTYPNACFAEKGQGYSKCSTTTPQTTCYVAGSCDPPIRQCYVNDDCPNVNACLGGSTSGIQKNCFNYMCSYTGTCANVACVTNSDCDSINDNPPCAGVAASCKNSVCVLEGTCIQQPIPNQNQTIWDLIAQIWNTFWNFVLSLF